MSFARAMGLEADELRTELRSWVRGQLRYGFISPQRCAEVLALIGEGGEEQ